MRIALATYALHIGGMETFILTLSQGLTQAGHEVHIVTTDARGAWFGRTREVGAQAHFIDGVNRRSRAGHARTVGQFLADGGFDAVINNFSWFVQASLGMLPLRAATVSVIHNSVESVVALSCANASACRAFVAPSPATFDLVCSRVPSREKVRLIPHGVELADAPEPRNNGHPPTVVCCGRLEHAQKGILLLPDIIRRASDCGVRIRLEVIGEGPDRDSLAGLVKEAGVSQQVDILGPLSHAQSLERIRKADVLLLPSFFEGLPLAPLEAMANGVIPVISMLPGITDWIVSHASSGFLVPPGDVKGFSDALILLGRDPELRRRMSLAAWETARERFSAARMVNSYLGLLDELTSRPVIPAGGCSACAGYRPLEGSDPSSVAPPGQAIVPTDSSVSS